MKRNYLMASLLVIAAAFSGCSQDEEFVNTNTSQTYQASVFASKGDITEVIENEEGPSTRALFVGGNTNRFATLWDKNDVVQVYQNGVNVGSLSLNDAANEKYQGTKDAYLTGTLTGNFSVGEELELYLPAKARSYTGQDGSITGLSSSYSYQKQTVEVDEVSGSGEQKTIKLKKANMDHRQAYLRLILTDENGKLLHPSQVTISTTSGSANRLVTGVAEDGTTMTYADDDCIVINPTQTNGEYPGELFVALLDGGYNESTHQLGGATYQFTAVVNGIAYTAKYDLTWTFANGALTRLTWPMVKADITMTLAPQMKILQGATKTCTPVVTAGSTDVTSQCTFSYSSSNSSVASVSSAGVVTGVAPGTAVITVASAAPHATVTTCTVRVTAPVEASEDNYVDFGLPSGTLWAKRNVGAESATDPGTYFAWGETEGYTSATNYEKNVFTWDTYKFGTSSPYTKYNNSPGQQMPLEAVDDPATANWGSGWSIPTSAQWFELGQNTDQEAITDYTGTLIGFKFTSPSDATKYIFLPVTGEFDGSGISDQGRALYWMNSTHPSPEYPYYALQAKSWYDETKNKYILNTGAEGNYRYKGCPVRAVYKVPNN